LALVTAMDRAVEGLLEELLQELGQLRSEMEALRQDVHTILEHMPMQMIPDRDSEVQ
jgi:polysaccharide deacetylase 2 family uncharacterized protein YibQ